VLPVIGSHRRRGDLNSAEKLKFFSGLKTTLIHGILIFMHS